MDRKILFISHNATRTGAPILLRNLARVLKGKRGYEIDFLIKNGGELKEEFFNEWKAQQFYNDHETALQNKIKRAKHLLNIKTYPYASNRYSFVFNNTIINGDIINLYSKSRVVTYVHELAHSIDALVSQSSVENIKNYSRLFLYPSKAVKDMLLSKLDVEENKLVYLPYYIEDQLHQKALTRQQMRQVLNVQGGEILVGAMGANDWRKGSDFFLFLANAHRNDPRFKFIWVGSDRERSDRVFNQMLFDKERLGLHNLVMIPSVPDSWKYLAAMDLFLLTSREDPYPLVALEAGMMEVPVACFEGSGGATEFVDNKCGFILPYLDFTATGNLLVAFKENRGLFAEYAQNARLKYQQLHSAQNVYEHFLQMLSKLDQRG